MSTLTTTSAVYATVTGALANAQEDIELAAGQAAVLTSDDLDFLAMSLRFYAGQLNGAACRKREAAAHQNNARRWWQEVAQ